MAADGLPAEVVAVPAAAEGAEGGQLIPAYHPGHQGTHPEVQGSTSMGDTAGGAAPFGSEISNSRDPALDGIAEKELRASVDAGALSLLLDPSSRQLKSDRVQQLLAQVLDAAVGGGLTAEAVARSLGLQRPGTVTALERAFGGGSGPTANLADTIRPRLAAQAAEQGAEAEQEEQAGSPSSSTFTAEQVEAGLSRLVQQVQQAPSTGSGALPPASPAIASNGPSSKGMQPTSKQYWQARADAALPAAAVRAWALLEEQAGKRLAMLQGRTGLADEVRAATGEGGVGPRC